MGYDVGRAITRWVEWLEEPREPDGKWHPSSMWGCTRQALYEVEGTPKSNAITPETKIIFRIGHLLHAFIQEAVENDEGILDSHAEVPVTHPALNITGHADQLIRDAEGWRLLEYKTTKGLSFVREKPKDDHLGQAFTYMYILRAVGATDAAGREIVPPLGDSLSRATIFYLSKGAEADWVSHEIVWSDDVEEMIHARLYELEEYRATGRLPDRLPDQWSARLKRTGRHPLCGYCAYQDTCWEGIE